MATWKVQLSQIRELRDTRNRYEDELYAIQIRTRKAKEALRKVRKKENSTFGRAAKSPAEAEGLVGSLQGEYKAVKERLQKSRDDLQRAIAELYIDRRLGDAVNNVTDGIPFLLLPVRIETRFMTSGASPELWLRIYPDDIAIHTHESMLTGKEVAEGKRYWRVLWDARTAGAPAENQKKSAWSELASLFGPQRAAWVAREMRPTNWDSTDAEPAFPAHDLTKPSAWSRAPRTNVLPDRFVVMLHEGDALVQTVVGNLIPDELMVGPDPMNEDNAFVEQDGKLLFGAEFDWSSDFPKAVTLGMGFKIPLTAIQAKNGFSKVLVLGLSLSRDAMDGKQALEALIDNHHYSPKGFSLIRQGTPTNNTDEEASGYTRNDEFSAISYYVETGNPLFTASDDTDGRDLADALGIDYGPLQYVRNSDATDYREAVAMNTVLYPGTLGYYSHALMQPVFDEATQEALRAFFIPRVTGRGPMPAIRVGDQPYGILLTSDFSRWQWSREEAAPDRGFLQTLQAVVQKYHALWLSVLGKVDYVGKPGADPHATLMGILGLQAGSVSFSQRIGYSTDYLRNLDAYQFGGRYFADMQRQFTSKTQALEFLSALGYARRDTQGLLKVPQLLRLLYQHYHTPLDAANLIDNVPLSERDPIRDYDEAMHKNYLDWLAEAQSIAVLESQDFGAGRSAPSALLYLMARRALLLQLHKASVRWFYRNNIDLRPTLEVRNFYNIRPEPDLTKWEAMKAKVGVAVPLHPYQEKSVADYLLTSGKSEVEASFLNDMRTAFQRLSPLPTARLERCFAEHVDVCTYRLDAWQTAIFGVRLQHQRQAITERRGRQQGVYLGAYGWVEDLRPAAKRQVVGENVPSKLRPANGAPLFEYADNGGFVHAPSLNQASAAAVLRAGYLSHAHSTQPDTLSVNLSSERIRHALFILQGVRNGQTLEALLGYQFERGLHDAASAETPLLRLNEYIYDFRDAFPLERHALKQQGSDAPVETIPANNVVNGVKLAEAGGDVPYGATGAVVGANAGEKAAIRKEKDRLADSLDAVKDLLQSEAVYQMVLGNVDRASAVINALQDTTVPPEIDIIDTPRSSRFTFTNRVVVQFEILDPADAASNPWLPIPMTPRAAMESGLNAWLGQVLGRPDDLFFRVAHLDKDGTELGHEDVSILVLALQPIDLVYIIGNELNTGVGQEKDENRTSASELEMRIAWYYRALKSLDETSVIRITFLQPANQKTLGTLLPLLRVLKSMITDARPLHAQDFDLPSKSQVDKTNPEGYDTVELRDRVNAIMVPFEYLLSDINTIPIDAIVKDQDGNEQHYLDLQSAFAALDAQRLSFSDITFVLVDTDAMTLQVKLRIAADAGLADAFPLRQSVTGDEHKAILLNQAMGVARRTQTAIDMARVRLAEADAASEIASQVKLRIAAAKALLGEVFNVLPRFSYNNEADIQLADGARTELLQHARDALQMPYPAEEWLQSVAHVRPKVARWDSILSLYECFHDDRLSLKPIQLPYRANDRWLAVAFPEADPDDPSQPFNIEHNTLSVTLHGDAAFVPGASRCGLLIDDWTEDIPTQNETTGIAFNFDQPNAIPPQALLLAVTPQLKGYWTWDDLVGILNDTLLRTKLRAVEPQWLDTIAKAETGVLLPAIIADFSQYDLNVALDYRLNIPYVKEMAPIQIAKA